jgi:ferric-dicitrate binding protein FerR (iron transport regulator)
MPRDCTRPYAVGAALAALLAVVATCAAAGAPSAGGVAATITVLEGQAEVVPPGSSVPIPAHVDLRVMPGSTIRTTATGRVELQFDDRSLLRLDHSTEIQILSGPQERGVMVSLGNIWAKVQSVFGASKFKVKTPTVVAGVRGTILRAEVSDEEAAIAVDEGEVEVAPKGGGPASLVKQDQEVRVRRGKMAAPPSAFSPEARQKWEFWTDPLVQQEIQGIHEAAAALRQACADVHRRTREINEALALDRRHGGWRSV